MSNHDAAAESHGNEYEVRFNVPNDVDAARAARKFVVEYAKGLEPGMLDDAELVVSELVTNAVQHGRPEILLRVRLHPPGIGLAVDDEGDDIVIPDDETPAAPDDSTSRGRGLMIARLLSTSWGVTPKDPPPGKTIWFELRPKA